MLAPQCTVSMGAQWPSPAAQRGRWGHRGLDATGGGGWGAGAATATGGGFTGAVAGLRRLSRAGALWVQGWQSGAAAGAIAPVSPSRWRRTNGRMPP